ncbi:MAG: GFA family protein [Alphaproteobacteria bacterium]|nr:GFA family protein [Alphaproteobacteria bacterium]MCA0450130.1 GFA family protein [Pseudomonadota bacterium]
MKISGGCHCGAVRYEVDGEALTHALCHCSDCRRHSGAPMVAWAMFPTEAVKTTKGAAKTYASSTDGRRYFCADCGTGLFYTNAAILPGITDVQSATFDDPNALPARAHIQTAERIGWMEEAHDLPMFERYPPQN